MVCGVLVLLGLLGVTVRHRRTLAKTTDGRSSRTAMFAKHAPRGALAASSSTLQAQRPKALDPPNFLIIMADDVGMYDLGYKDSLIKSPSIDALARSGVVIDRFYTQSLCTPGRGAFLTGLYPVRTGTQYDTVQSLAPWGLDTDVWTLPQYIKDRGYATHLVGKWHLGYARREFLPTARGFDTYLGYLESEATYYTHQTTDACDCDGPWYDLVKSTPDRLYFVTDNTTRSDVMYAARAEQIIKAHNTSLPMYLQMSFQNAHTPLPDVLDGDFSDDQLAYLSTVTYPARKRFTASVMKLDDAVQRILNALEDRGMLNNTYVVFLSDNGACYEAGGLNVPFRGTKRHLWEGGVRTPSFISGPLVPTDRRGSNYTGMFHVTDWAPTILSLAGWGSDDDIADLSLDGYNHATTLFRESEDSPRTELLLNFENVTTDPKAGIIVGKWKLLLGELNQSWYTIEDTLPFATTADENSCNPSSDTVNSDYGDWLFDLEADPLETTNLFDGYPEVVQTLRDRINVYLADGVPSYEDKYPDDYSAIGAFKATGYVCPWQDTDRSYLIPPTYVGPFDPM